MPDSNYWTLPASPDALEYQLVLKQAETLPDEEALALVRAVAEADYWFYCRYVTTLRAYLCRDPENKWCGRLWVEHPWVFDRCRELQADYEGRVQNKWCNWPRYHLKTTLRTVYPILWLLSKDPQSTNIVLTYKVDKVGLAMFSGITDELLGNAMLSKLWPETFPQEKKQYPLFTSSAITVPRRPGPREPSVSMHALNNMPTSFHPDNIFVDDVVVKETVSTQEMIQSTSDSLRNIVALRSDYTWVTFCGTVWDANDSWIEGVREGYFSERDHWTCYGRPADMEKGETILHSEEMIKEWRVAMGEYVFACQMLGIPVAKNRRIFYDEWLLPYRNPPRVEGDEKNKYIFVDFSGEGTDYHSMFVMGTGSDKRYYALDLWREQYGLNEALELLFRLVAIWEPKRVYVEEFGAAGYMPMLQREMEWRKFRFPMVALPKIKRSKIQRIEALAPILERGEMYWPFDGFGHGSRTDQRDTYLQFQQDEYRLWSPVKKSTLTDDMLDSVSWPFQPEVIGSLDFPENFDPNDPFDPRNRKQQNYEPSAWAW